MVHRRLLSFAIWFLGYVCMWANPQSVAGAEATNPPMKRTWSESKVGRMLQQLDEMQQARKMGQEEWARQLRAIIEVGPDAVPEIIAALDATPSDDRLMLRTLPYLLRGIGDKRAIPALIRAIPRCNGPDGSDMGYHTADAELGGFLARNDAHKRPGTEPITHSNEYSYGRPINEVCPTLEKWAGTSNRWLELVFIQEGEASPRQVWLRKKLFHDCATRWADWWALHWKEYVDDPRLADVGIAPFDTEEVPSPLLDLNRPLKRITGSSNNYCEPFSQSGVRFCFRDLDTGRQASLPEQWKGKTAEELLAEEENLAAWAGREGFDLMGVETVVDGKPKLLIRPVQLDVWEVSMELWKDHGKATAQQIIDQGRWTGKVLCHRDEVTGQEDLDGTGAFFFVTTEGTPGMIFLGVQVFEVKWTPGERSTGIDELKSTGQHRGRRYATKAMGIEK